MTNFEKIKSMTVEEMAIAINKLSTLCMHPDGCNDCPIHTKEGHICNSQDIMNWLKNDVEEENRKRENSTRCAKWIISSDGYYPYCSECRKEPESGKMTDYCLNCGARMVGDNND